MLEFADNVFLEVEMLESLGCRLFCPVIAFAVVLVDEGGQGDVRHVQIGSAEVEGNSIFDALICRHDF